MRRRTPAQAGLTPRRSSASLRLLGSHLPQADAGGARGARAILPCPRATGRRSTAGVRHPVSCLALTNKATWQAGRRVHPGRLEKTLTNRVHGRGPQVWGARPGGPPVRHCRPVVHSRDKSAAVCGHRPPKPHDARCGALTMRPDIPAHCCSVPRCQGAHPHDPAASPGLPPVAARARLPTLRHRYRRRRARPRARPRDGAQVARWQVSSTLTPRGVRGTG